MNSYKIRNRRMNIHCFEMLLLPDCIYYYILSCFYYFVLIDYVSVGFYELRNTLRNIHCYKMVLLHWKNF